jgi:Alginate lyase
LEALFDATSIADKLGMDLWNYQTPDKRSIRKALDWLLPFAIGAKKWSHQQISAWQPERLAPLLRRAALEYREVSYENALTKLAGVTADGRFNLLYAKPVATESSSN